MPQDKSEELTDAEIVGVPILSSTNHVSGVNPGWNQQVKDWADAAKMNVRCCKSLIGVVPTYPQTVLPEWVHHFVTLCTRPNGM